MAYDERSVAGRAAKRPLGKCATRLPKAETLRPPRRVDAPRTVASMMSNRVTAPMESSAFTPKNQVLSALPGRDFASLQPHLRAVLLTHETMLFDVDQLLTHIYFVETGVVSLRHAFEDRVTVGVAAVGREGAVDLQTLLLGGNTALGRWQILVPGSALAVEVSRFWQVLRRSPKLRMACEAFTRALFVQVLQAIPCHRLHTVEQRCARWLLMCADRMEDDTFELSPESLAQILCVARSAVTAIVGTLQQAELIRYDRNEVTVLDRRGLAAAACECYRIVRTRCERLPARGVDSPRRT
jgi:CRP-like cAMP-binding protein